MSKLSAAIKPEIFISWVPIGKIGFKPQIYASIIQTPEKTIADTSRQVAISESNVADTLRQINVTEKNPADTLRQVTKVELAIADTSRRLGFLKIVADIERRIKAVEKINVDTCRRLGNSENAHADIERVVGNTETGIADTLLRTAVTEKIVADLMRGIREIARADTLRQVTRTEKAVARTVIRIPHVLNYSTQSQSQAPNEPQSSGQTDTSLSLVNTFKDYGVTSINITLSEKTLSDDFRFELAARTIEINESVQGTLLDYPFDFLVEETTQTDGIQSVTGRYSSDDLHYTWFLFSLTDDDTPKAKEIVEAAARYLSLQSVIKIDDFTPSNIERDSEMTYADMLNNAFGWTSRLPQRQINIFIRGGVLYCIQRGKEDSVFDITDLPHSRPIISKKFNRVLCKNPNNDNTNGNTGNNAGDDDDGVLFSGVIGYVGGDFLLEYHYENGLLRREYHKTRTNEVEAVSTTTYSYVNHGKDTEEYYLDTKVEQNSATQKNDDENTKIKTTVQTGYHYAYTRQTESGNSEIYLVSEHEVTTTEEYELNHTSEVFSKWDLVADENHLKQTFHAPVGNGWYGQAVYLDGAFQGANLSQGKPGNRVSPYTVKAFQTSFSFQKIADNNDNGEEDDELSAIYDDSFPVEESDVKDTLNAALRWLHRKIIETVSVDLISEIANGVPSIQHVVDFTERVRFDGSDYFLVSNRISFTPRKFIQRLQLIRWY